MRVARRAGIVVIFEEGLETKQVSNSVSVLKALTPKSLLVLPLHGLNSLPIMVRGKGKEIKTIFKIYGIINE